MRHPYRAVTSRLAVELAASQRGLQLRPVGEMLHTRDFLESGSLGEERSDLLGEGVAPKPPLSALGFITLLIELPLHRRLAVRLDVLAQRCIDASLITLAGIFEKFYLNASG